MATKTIADDPKNTPTSEPKTKPRARKSATKQTSPSPQKRSRTKKEQEPQKAVLSAKAAALPREIAGLLFLVTALAVLLATVSFSPLDLNPGASVQNLIGPVGAKLGDILLTVFGLGSFFLDLLLWYVGLMLLVGKRIHWKPSEIIGQLFFVMAGTILSHMALFPDLFFGHRPGGLLGEMGGEILRGLFGTVGTYLIASCLIIISVMLATDISLSSLVRTLLATMHRSLAYFMHQWHVHREYRVRLKEERLRLEASELYNLEAQARLEAELSVTPIAKNSYPFEERFEDDVDKKLAHKLQRIFQQPRPEHDKHKDPPKRRRPKNADALKEADDTTNLDNPSSKKTPYVAMSPSSNAQDAPKTHPKDDSWSMGDPIPTHPEPIIHIKTPPVDDARSITLDVDEEDVIDMQAEHSSPAPLGDAHGDFGPRIIEHNAKERSKRIKELLAKEDGSGLLFKPQKRGNFELPSLSYLNYQENGAQGVDIEVLRQMAAQIEQTLRDFKVEGHIKDICPGPVITVFEFSPAAGVKISRIATLADDLAMSLAALSVRIVAPIPGKGVVGIEVPNPTRETVYMKEVLAEDTFHKNEKMDLPMGLGKDTAGNCIVADLARMPHLLVAGATGSGKSVAVNTMITSLLYKNSPDDVRMIMVDPKMLEFSIYADIPHLLLPVVTDPKKATTALNWVVQEMERRYQMLADMSVRNINGYNDKIDRFTTQAHLDMAQQLEESPAIAALGIDAEGKPSHVRLPYIVVIIDEFADLMMTASKDVETAVARLAQKARAAGIHLILATQRPSTDVITGLIKANFPTRIALRVTSKTDSRVILDSNGAENLLGMGDMLFVPPGSSHIKRVHGAYVSETEIEKIVDFLKAQGQPEYNEEILAADEEEVQSALAKMDRDQHYEDAVRLVIESKQASISMIQRKLRVGYNRAARMVEMMELEGLVSPPDGCKPREILTEESPY